MEEPRGVVSGELVLPTDLVLRHGPKDGGEKVRRKQDDCDAAQDDPAHGQCDGQTEKHASLPLGVILKRRRLQPRRIRADEELRCRRGLGSGLRDWPEKEG